MDPVKRTGLIGLGAMGLQMAKHMVAKGFDVAGTDIDVAAMQRAKDIGVRTVDAAEVAHHSDVAIVMVATDQQVEDAVAGLLQYLKPNSVICIASSVAPETCRRLAAQAAAKNIGVLDTPVVLGQEAANNGTLTIYVGGDDAAFARAEPVLKAFGAKMLHLGGSGTGQIAKTINNMLLWSCMAANFEALTLAKTLGADIPRLVTALNQGSGANWSLSRWGKSTGKWAVKDMDVAMKLAKQAGVETPLGSVIEQLVKGINQDRMKALLS